MGWFIFYMKKFNYILVLLISFAFAPKPVIVTYHFQSKGLRADVDRKISITKQRLSDDIIVEETRDSISLSQLLGRFSFSQKFIISAYAGYSIVKFEGSVSGNNSILVNTPDRLVYKNGLWKRFKEENSKGEIISEVKIRYQPTDEFQKILGYNCRKYTATKQDNGEQLFIWGTNDLPTTLLPISGLKKFECGILKVEEVNGMWSITAKQIE